MNITTTLTAANSALTVSGTVLSLVTLLSQPGAPGVSAATGGGYAANLYLSNVNSAVSGYKKLCYTPDVAEVTKTIVASDNTVQGEKYLFDEAIDLTEIKSGTWVKNFTRKVSASIKVSTFQVRAFMYTTGGVENDIFTITSSEINDTDFVTVRTENTEVQFVCNATDRFGVQISFTTARRNNTTLSYLVGGKNAAYFLTPVALRHSLLRTPNEDPEVQHMTSAEKTVLDGITYNAGNPAVDTNPSSTSVLWINTTSGEIFTCTDITAGSNVWVGQLGSTVP